MSDPIFTPFSKDQIDDFRRTNSEATALLLRPRVVLLLAALESAEAAASKTVRYHKELAAEHHKTLAESKERIKEAQEVTATVRSEMGKLKKQLSLAKARIEDLEQMLQQCGVTPSAADPEEIAAGTTDAAGLQEMIRVTNQLIRDKRAIWPLTQEVRQEIVDLKLRLDELQQLLQAAQATPLEPAAE